MLVGKAVVVVLLIGPFSRGHGVLPDFNEVQRSSFLLTMGNPLSVALYDAVPPVTVSLRVYEEVKETVSPGCGAAGDITCNM